MMFETMEKRDVVSWTMMITGFGQHGKGKEAIDILRMMLSEGFKPDDITLLGDGIKPRKEHFACVIDMLGRAGRLKEAEIFIQQTGVGSEVFVWEALLGACSIHGELELGERSAEKIMKLEPRRNQPTCYWRIYMLIGDYGRTRKRSERAWRLATVDRRLAYSVPGRYSRQKTQTLGLNSLLFAEKVDLAFELSGARNISPTVPGGSTWQWALSPVLHQTRNLGNLLTVICPRFQDWSSERSLSSERHFSAGGDSGKFTETVSSISERIWRGLSRGSEGIRHYLRPNVYILIPSGGYSVYRPQIAWVGIIKYQRLVALHCIFPMFGASWYLLSIERQDSCWRKACGDNQTCNLSLYCGADSTMANTINVTAQCVLNDTSPFFDFGIYLDALTSGVVESSDFPSKLFYCLWWGLRSLSSLGQNLETSTFVGEILFAISISIFGLVLFSLLIGNMQTYLQSNTVRLEEMRVKRRDAEQWMSHRLLPDPLKQRIRRYEQYKWQETRGVDEQNLICNLPKDLRRDIKRHLCLNLLMRVPMFEKMDEQLLDAMCDHLKPALYTDDSYIVREGDPVGEMLFIMRGKLLSVTTNGGRTGFFNSDNLKEGDFCGEELLTWALDPNSNNNLPISTRTVRALTEVEGFALMADHLKSVASQFRRLHSKQLRHTFRFYSQQWRTWAACFIQAAWRRYSKKKAVESLQEEEDRLQDALAKGGGTSPSLGATIYASRFAANALRAIRQHGSRKARLQERLPPLILQKPAEPDFSAEAPYKPIAQTYSTKGHAP
ncbi:hypothetical protein C5167_023047 [Papaver somniferum]|uniref:Cyclic nucleotide-binding domain-containing protein n=1 Tax=Papaver somniferum TaxID=3469 RepID=A0A4Y7JKK6_PAPSO|nr:hypothetical protein C5167_023047 [Papaver somniferum]